MKNYIKIILFICVALALNIYAKTTYDLAQDNVIGTKIFNEAQENFYKTVEGIQKSADSSAYKALKIQRLRDEFMAKSRKLQIKYRQAFLEAVLEETNENLPSIDKVKRTLGSDIYIRDSHGNVLMDKLGNPQENIMHRGMMGDTDLGATPRGIASLDATMNKYGVQSDTKMVKMLNGDSSLPNHLDWGGLEVTANNGGPGVNTVLNSNAPDMSLHETQMYKASLNPDGSISAKKNLSLNAISKETYNFIAMAENQGGSSLVLTLDHNKKAIEGFKASAKSLLTPKAENIFQGMNKGTLKAMGSGIVTDDQLIKIIAKNKLNMSVASFKKKLNLVKGGHIPSGIGIFDAKEMEKYKNTCEAVMHQAVQNSTKVANIELKNVNNKIRELHDLAANSLDGPQKSAYNRQAKMWAEQNLDSKQRIQSNIEANNAKMNAKTKGQKILEKGGKVLQVAGYAFDGYQAYSTLKLYHDGNITKQQMQQSLGGQGAGIATDVTVDLLVGQAAVGSMGTISIVAIPLVVGIATSYYVGKATEEGLALMAAYENEDLLNEIADKQMKITANKFTQTAEIYLTHGIRSGDYNDFIAAEDLSYRLYDLYEKTGDEAFLNASDKIFDRTDEIKNYLEIKHGVPIYAVQDKLKKEAKETLEKARIEKEKEKEKQDKEPPVMFFDAGGDENSFRYNMQSERDENAKHDAYDASISEQSAIRTVRAEAAEFGRGMEALAGSLRQVQTAMIAEQNAQTQAENVARNAEFDRRKDAFAQASGKSKPDWNVPSNTRGSNNGFVNSDPYAGKLQSGTGKRTSNGFGGAYRDPNADKYFANGGITTNNQRNPNTGFKSIDTHADKPLYAIHTPAKRLYIDPIQADNSGYSNNKQDNNSKIYCGYDVSTNGQWVYSEPTIFHKVSSKNKIQNKADVSYYYSGFGDCRLLKSEIYKIGYFEVKGYDGKYVINSSKVVFKNQKIAYTKEFIKYDKGKIIKHNKGGFRIGNKIFFLSKEEWSYKTGKLISRLEFYRNGQMKLSKQWNRTGILYHSIEYDDNGRIKNKFYDQSLKN